MLKIILTLILALFISCSENKTETENQTSQVKLEESDQVFAQTTALKLVETLSGDLKKSLMAAMKDGGAANAVEACAESAPLISEKISSDFWTIKRVSDRMRSITTPVEEHELEILNIFKDSSGMSYYDEWIETDSSKFYTYYKPIRIGKFCMNCHGSSNDISPKVSKVLEEKYPDDMAKDYKEGDLRGMFVVKAIWPEAKEEAIKLSEENKID